MAVSAPRRCCADNDHCAAGLVCVNLFGIPIWDTPLKFLPSVLGIAAAICFTLCNALVPLLTQELI